MRTLILWACLLPALAASGQDPKPYSCEEKQEHRQFDFWVGNWEVTDKAGEQVYGHNSISKREAGCLLLEEWRSAGAHSGSSLNYYSPSDSQWHQLWVDNGASIIRYSGGMEDGSMVMRGGLALHPGGSFVQNRGFDGTGVHCSKTARYDVPLATAPVTEFPSVVEECETAVQAMMRYRSKPKTTAEVAAAVEMRFRRAFRKAMASIRV